jgi:hypothetical protein
MKGFSQNFVDKYFFTNKVIFFMDIEVTKRAVVVLGRTRATHTLVRRSRVRINQCLDSWNWRISNDSRKKKHDIKFSARDDLAMLGHGGNK